MGYPSAWLREWQDALPISEEYIRHHTVLVAERGGAIVGVAAWEETSTQAEVCHPWVLRRRRGTALDEHSLNDC